MNTPPSDQHLSAQLDSITLQLDAHPRCTHRRYLKLRKRWLERLVPAAEAR